MFPIQLDKEEQSRLKEISIDKAANLGALIKEKDYFMHVPFALYPSPFSKQAYDFVVELQPLFNHLVDQIARDYDFLEQIMKQLSESDDFTKRIYDLYVENLNNPQKVWLGIHRSDYLLHEENGQVAPKQVELNTISSSFSSLSSKITQLHQYSMERFGFKEKLPSNSAGDSFADILAKAFFKYGNTNAYLLMIVQPGENNVYDQRHIEEVLFAKHGIRTIRRTLAEVYAQGNLVSEMNRMFIGNKEIAISYFRAGYAPTDYPSENEWKARSLIEKSYSIKCPNAAYHLAGTKKIQQVLAEDGILKKFMSVEHSKLLAQSFTGLYPLDSSAAGIQAYNNALDNPEKYVLKPQREGGGILIL
jgi:glutathione synthase